MRNVGYYNMKKIYMCLKGYSLCACVYLLWQGLVLVRPLVFSFLYQYPGNEGGSTSVLTQSVLRSSFSVVL